MRQRSAAHSTFVIKREFDAAPARVFAAWSHKQAKGRWFVGPEGWEKSDYQFDFKVGGREHLSGGPPGQPPHVFDARYYDIVPDQRIVYGYEMHIGDHRISVSLATIEFKPSGKGTQLVLTEQGVFLDGYDDAGSREQGTRQLMDQLAASLATSA
jgi:uncharacterized protein YndB with AHSA1/START domain